MDYQDIKKLIEDMGNSNLDSLEIEFPEGTKISMTKNANRIVTTEGLTQVMEKNNSAIVPAVLESTEKSLVNVVKQEENVKIIKSPMVGTFYESSAPNQEAFVKVGDKIHKGQVVCIVEAMKLMNEIESEFDGEIIEICVKNEEVVEYGMPLFKIKQEGKNVK